jgi:hypothetical protein
MYVVIVIKIVEYVNGCPPLKGLDPKIQKNTVSISGI